MKKELTAKQIERLATKNREASAKQFKQERDQRGPADETPKTKEKDDKQTYVSHTDDPKFADVDHESLFALMKRLPYTE